MYHIEGGSVIEVAIEPKTSADREHMLAAVKALTADDPSIRCSHDVESGQTILGGQTDEHLDVAVHKIVRIYGVALNIGAPQVAYRERLTRAVEISHTHKKLMGNAGEFASIRLLFEPAEPNSGLTFENAVANNALLEAHVSGVRQGLEASCQNGVLAGFPVIGIRVTLTDGAYHEADSNCRTFEIAARQAFRMLGEKRALELVEPIFAAEVTTPDAFLGEVVGDLRKRRGQILTVEQRDDASLIKAFVPASNMFGYLNTLRALTRGVGTASLRPDHYASVPRGTDDDPRFPPAAAMRA